MLGLEQIGFLPDNIKIFERLIRRPNGIILITGPTGSGKTTTLYSALNTINNVDTKIITVENPVEYQIEGINQIQVNEAIGLTFGASLRSILRQSPDVILVGEIRDSETAAIATRAALTGHLVFSTLHTNDAPSAPTRLIEMGIKPFLVASSVQAVMAQRLIRLICTECKETYQPDPHVIEEFGMNPDEHRASTFYRGRGCETCNFTGYRGRSAIHEIMVMSNNLKNLILQKSSAEHVRQVARTEGMRVLREDGWLKVLKGDTTIAEVARITMGDKV
jgi:type II secretory ATPase GspE/PulE/Tfp pilus assembly ATPase PilB-like protein